MRFIADGESTGDISSCGVDESEVRLVFLVKGSWYANEDSISFCETTRVGGGAEEGGVLEYADEIRAEMVEIGFTTIEHFDFFGVAVDSDDITARIEHGTPEGDADITEPNDGDGARVRQVEGGRLGGGCTGQGFVVLMRRVNNDAYCTVF